MSDEPRHLARGAGFVVEVTVSLVLGAVVGVLGTFAELWTVRGIWVGVIGGVLAAAVLSLVLARALRDGFAPLAAGAGWFVCVGYFATGRPEGDVVLPGSGQGYTFLLLGLLAFLPGARVGLDLQRSAQPAATPAGRDDR